MAGNTQEVTVTDIKIPFMSMVVLLVKWALAAIPAMIILFVIATILSMMLSTFFGGTFGWRAGM